MVAGASTVVRVVAVCQADNHTVEVMQACRKKGGPYTLGDRAKGKKATVEPRVGERLGQTGLAWERGREATGAGRAGRP